VLRQSETLALVAVGWIWPESVHAFDCRLSLVRQNPGGSSFLRGILGVRMALTIKSATFGFFCFVAIQAQALDLTLSCMLTTIYSVPDPNQTYAEIRPTSSRTLTIRASSEKNAYGMFGELDGTIDRLLEGRIQKWRQTSTQYVFETVPDQTKLFHIIYLNRLSGDMQHVITYGAKDGDRLIGTLFEYKNCAKQATKF
jgi:hypothetical protein